MAKEPLILIPGVLCTAELWRDQVAALGSAADVAVTLEQQRHDSAAAIARAILAAAPPRFALAGLSMGGMVAFEIMRQAPDRVSRLALLDTTAEPDTSAAGEVRRARLRLVEAGQFELVLGLQLARFLPPWRLADTVLVDRVLAMLRASGPAVYLRQERAVIARADSRPTLGTIRCPTLVLSGREDAATPLPGAELIAAGVPGARLVVLERCGHLSTMERPDEVNAALADWLTW
jgi:pimeloyl-ACP methyl ester carboxylesterase